MSRGLGRWQIAFLRALAKLEDEHGVEDGRAFYLHAVCRQMYADSPELRQIEEERNNAAAQRIADQENKAKNGDEEARRLLFLRRSVMSSRRQEGRPAVRDDLGSMESVVNSTRLARSLAGRGMIGRDARPGFAVVWLLEAGRSAISV